MPGKELFGFSILLVAADPMSPKAVSRDEFMNSVCQKHPYSNTTSCILSQSSRLMPRPQVTRP
jgi:hypothetical protein